MAERQAAAALTNSAAEPAGSVAAAAPAQPAATAATPAANGTAAATSGTTAAAAEVADAARRLRMDQALAARAQAELRISKPQVGRPFLITVYVSHRYRQGWRRGRRQSCASASRRSGSGTSSHQRHCLRVLLPGLPQLNHKLCPEASAWPPVMGSVRAELPAAASVWQSAPPRCSHGQVLRRERNHCSCARAAKVCASAASSLLAAPQLQSACCRRGRSGRRCCMLSPVCGSRTLALRPSRPW